MLWQTLICAKLDVTNRFILCQEGNDEEGACEHKIHLHTIKTDFDNILHRTVKLLSGSISPLFKLFKIYTLTLV